MHTRRSIIVIEICLCLLGLGWELPPSRAGEKPNVVIIYTDDQGYGDTTFNNRDAKFETPNIDRIAREGVAFTDGHCSDTVCTPSRYGLLTGRYAWRTRLKKGVMGAEGECLIAPDRLTVASMLKSCGYRTAMVGKWHLGMDFPGTSYRDRDWSQPVREMPLDRGFDYYFGVPASLNYGVLAWFEGRTAKVPPTMFTAKKPNDRHVDYRIMPPYHATPEAARRELKGAPIEVAPDFVDDQCLTRFTDAAIAWLQKVTRTGSAREARPAPFMLYVSLTSPHYPVCPRPEFYGKGQAGGYGEFMVETDYHVGRLLNALEELGVLDDTLVIFTSDNGPENSWKQRAEQFEHHSNHIYREGKRSIYEGGHRVPFYMRWPSGIDAPGRKWEGTVCQTDVLATLAEIVGFDLPADAGEDSYSLAAVLRPGTSQLDHPPVIHHAANGRFAVRRGPWKLVMPHGKLPIELYHLPDDPSEARNVAEEHPDIVAQLQEAITKIVLDGRTTQGPAQPNDTGYWADLTWIDPAEYPAHR
ncbi:MAG: arylsulfatase [Planctomycetota bacterium]|nr:MAG: arylsulfatase [Planctomycetota bacterium]